MVYFLRSLLLIPFALALEAGAQTATPPAEARTPFPEGPRVERITHEDGLSRIDELRVGGQTRSIDVQPKNGAPAYQVAPAQNAESPGQGSKGNAGKSSWRVLSF
jgi:hypothetical protein